jgi:hypothetical protein
LLELKRTSPVTLAEDAAKGTALDALRLRTLRIARRGRRDYAPGVSAADAPLTSAMGHSNAQNALAAGLVAAVVALSAGVLNAWLLPDSRPPDFLGIHLAEYARWTVRWFALGFAFGYLYPLLRGTSPLAKAAGLGALVVTGETVAGLVVSPAEPSSSLGAVALQAGQVAVLVIVLTLYWEWRLSRAARVPFLLIRDLRSFRAFALPLSALVLAASTAAGTALAGAAVSPLLTPTPAPERPVPPSGAPTPSPPPRIPP